VLSLGSNIGDRIACLQGALDSLAARGVQILAVSSVYETAPVGGPDQDDFLNAVALVRTSVEPRELLALCQQVEAEHHRIREVRWGPRTLDVDLIEMDGVAMADEILTLPHPRAHERAFVCIPWLEVDPGAVLLEQPLSALTLDTTGVVRREDMALRVPESDR
jgi:2-amino-4-hydroxy-6-hydroxymethyldihydropteridine diphosphokinase